MGVGPAGPTHVRFSARVLEAEGEAEIFNTLIGHSKRGILRLLYFNQETRIEFGILVYALFSIAARIAHHPRSVQEVVDAVVNMPVYPKPRPVSIDEVLGIGDEA